MIDIFNVKPNKVSRDLDTRKIFLYGEPKTGKTTMLSKMDKVLVLATEDGYQNIPGIMAIPINSWGEIKKVLKQLSTDEAKETYKVIGLDTLDIAVDLCSKFICAQEGVQTLADIPFGKGTVMLEKEFDETIRKIPRMGYGLVMISHSQARKVVDPVTRQEYHKIIPTVPERIIKIANRLADLTCYAHTIEENGKSSVVLELRGGERALAGGRFAEGALPDRIPFTYEALSKTIKDAVDYIEQENGSDLMTDSKETVDETLSYPPIEDMIASFQKMANEACEKDATFFRPRIQKIVEDNLGTGKTLADASVGQEELVDTCLDELKIIIENYDK